MKHVGLEALAALDDLRCELRAVDGLVERQPGVFQHRSRAFLHFHEDATGLYADVRLDGETFDRLRVSTAAERVRLVHAVRVALRAG